MTRKLLLLLALSSLAAFSNAIAYDGYKVYEITPSTAEQANLLHELSQRIEALDFFSLSKIPQRKAHVLVPPVLEAELVAFLEQHKIAGHVLNSNFGEELSKDFATNMKLRQLAAATAGKGRLSTERYYSYEEMMNYSADLAARYPARVFLKNVGKSYEGRIMQTLTITNGDGRKGKNVIFVDCGFHAREWISPAMGLYLIDQLVENYEQNADLLLDYDWQIMLLVNPDGYDHSMKSSTTRLWRKTRQPHQYLGRTCYGTDPNRNFPFHWMEGGASSVPCLDTFAGPTPFSDPETIVVRDVLHSLHGRGIMYLTLHSHGYYLLYPWGWTEELPEDWRSLDEVARAGGDAIYNATGSEYSVGSSTTVLYIAAGASDDYAYSIGFPISITMELPSGGSSGFDPPPSSIDPFVKETWIGIRAMAEKVIEKYPTERNSFF